MSSFSALSFLDFVQEYLSKSFILSTYIIKKSLRCCALSNAIMEDDEIACSAPGTQLASGGGGGGGRLRIAMENQNEGECIDPFTLSDIEDNPQMN